MATPPPPVVGCLHQAVVHGVRVLRLALGMQVPPPPAVGVLVVVVGALVQRKTPGEVPVHGQQVLHKTQEELPVVGQRVQLNPGQAVQVQMQDLVLPIVVGGRPLNRAGVVLLNRPADGTYNASHCVYFSVNHIQLIDISCELEQLPH